MIKSRYILLGLLLLCCLSAGVFGVVLFWPSQRPPGPAAEAPVIRTKDLPQRKAAIPRGEEELPEYHREHIAKVPPPASLIDVPRDNDLVRDLAGVLVAAYQPAAPCARSGKGTGKLRLSVRELVRRYEPSLAKSPETSIRLSVSPPMLEIGFMFVSGRFAGEVRSRAREAVRLCPASGEVRPLTPHESEEALALIAAWIHDMAACARQNRGSTDCEYARKLAFNLLQGEESRDRVIATAGRLLDDLAGKIGRDVVKTGG